MKEPDSIILPRSVRDDVHDAILHMVECVEEENVERDARILKLREQLDGKGNPVIERWANSADVEDTLTIENHLDVMAAIFPGFKRETLAMMIPELPEDADKARVIERWSNLKANKANFQKHGYDALYHATSGLFGVMCVEWVYKDGTLYSTALKDTINDTLLTDDMEPDDDKVYERVPIREDVVLESGIRFRVPQPEDFYLYPATSSSVENALACVERMRFTRHGLLSGIEEFGFDRKAVLETIRAYHSSDTTEAEQTRLDEAGITESEGEPSYCCYFVIGRVPILMDDTGNLRTPENLLKTDWMWMVCPGAKTVLMSKPWPHPVRPYATVNGLRVPGNYIGKSTVSILEPLQREATVLWRSYLDSVDIACSPMIVTTERNEARFGQQKVGPGLTFKVVEDVQKEMMPFVWNMSGLAQMDSAWAQVNSKAYSLASAQGRPGMGADKVRKAAEVNAMEQMVASKFEMVFWNAQQLVGDVFKIMLKMYAGHLGWEGEEVATPDGKTTTISRADLNTEVNIVAAASTETANPMIRAQQVMRKQAIQAQYVQAALQAPPEWLPMLWHGAREALSSEGEQRPEAWIGPQPNAQEIIAERQQAEQVADEVLAQQGQLTPGQGAIPTQPVAGPVGGVM